MVLDLMLIGLGITLEPFPLTAFILATGNNPPKPQTAPSNAALAVKLLAGVALILVAVRKKRQMGRPRQPPAWMARLDRLSLLSVAGLAAFLQPWTLVAAGAATIMEAKLDTVGSYLVLVLFCLLATASYLYLELYAAFAGAGADAKLMEMRDWLDSHQDQVIIVVFLLLGFWLAGKSIYLLLAS